ncbi:MAG: type II toxin-antitoxin system YhaV family toxin [Acidobacteria bacterium]|nr:type II toxin-antitoxin system YhaV family toxin [Acidobacteriota bacterium]
MATNYVVELTEEAEKVYARLHEEALECLKRGDFANSKVTAFNMVEEVLDRIIPHDPFNPSRALTGTLSNIFRIKKGRMRVCYIGSSRDKRIIILYISDTLRKEGDINDPYSVFSRMVLSGRFDMISSLKSSACASGKSS